MPDKNNVRNQLGCVKEKLNNKKAKKKIISQSGNWTPVSRVTGGDTHHYTNWDFKPVAVDEMRNSRNLFGHWCKVSARIPPYV